MMRRIFQGMIFGFSLATVLMLILSIVLLIQNWPDGNEAARHILLAWGAFAGMAVTFILAVIYDMVIGL